MSILEGADETVRVHRQVEVAPPAKVTIGPDGPIGPLLTGVAWDPDGHGGHPPRLTGEPERELRESDTRRPANDARTGLHP